MSLIPVMDPLLRELSCGCPPLLRGQKTRAQQISFYKIKIYLDELIFAVMMMMNHETRSL